ncbi:class I SAM-dependent methyltransferase [Camelliibacillus cellulosilyticus]|uniref:Class I SAM-dependent methyltransferase n=1 Tax=Camelliibacillus cellulosilyticus TaxID=2174486 RepID=A0ABV9GP65_9BACL
MNDVQLKQFLKEQAKKPFSGWDFSYLSETGRLSEEPLPWSYGARLFALMRQSKAMLDMGTGGGEFLSAMQPLPEYTAATESYAPNVPIAGQRLEPLGVEVAQVDPIDEYDLPFTDERFDLVANRHESYAPNEVFRVLKPGGIFITQQVGGQDNADLNDRLGASPDFGYAHWDLTYAVNQLRKVGFSVTFAEEAFPYSRFYDVGAIVYFLSAIPWQIADFSVDRYFEGLKNIHAHIAQNGYFDSKTHRFIIIAEKH